MFRQNSDTQSDELIRSDRRDDRLQTIVPASGAAFADAYRAKRQREIIRNHDELLDRRLALDLREQARDGLSTQVHEGLRFYELRPRTFNLAATNERAALAAVNANSLFVGQLVNQHKPEIVSRRLVLFPGIS